LSPYFLSFIYYLKMTFLKIRRVRYEMANQIFGLWFQAGTRNICLLSSVQKGSAAHPNFLCDRYLWLHRRGKAAEAWIRSLTFT
jgi:hypothetical protein